MSMLVIGYGSPTHVCVTTDRVKGLHIIIVTRVHVILSLSTLSSSSAASDVYKRQPGK